MDDFEIAQLFQAAADAAVDAGWSDEKMREELAEAIEKARDE